MFVGGKRGRSAAGGHGASTEPCCGTMMGNLVSTRIIVSCRYESIYHSIV